MDGTLGLLAGIPGGGGSVGGMLSGGSILSMSKDDDGDNHSMSAEVSSSCPVDDDDDDDLELGLGLSIGGGLKTKEEDSRWGEYARILTSKDFPSLMSRPYSSCSSSSSSSAAAAVNIPNSSTAVDSVSPPNATSVVGWPPIRRAHRMPLLANRIKSEHNEFNSRVKSKNKTNGYLSVKVNMDGTLIGRKVDLNAHSSYEMLAQTLEDMFYGKLGLLNFILLRDTSCHCLGSSTEAVGSSRLLNGTSKFVLTYEDRDGDCMLVGDVPWQMFLSSVKRLRILRNPRSSGLALRFQEKDRRQRTDAI